MNNTIIPDKFEDLEPFSCLEIRLGERLGFEEGVRRFKSMIQKAQILSLYKDRQHYEKPSDKKRRKRKEARDRRRIAEYREKLIMSGEWDKRQKRKEKRREERMNRRRNNIDDE